MTLEAVKDHTKSSSFQTSQYFAVFRKDNFTKFFTGKSCLPTEKRGRLLIVDLNHYVHIWTELALEQVIQEL